MKKDLSEKFGKLIAWIAFLSIIGIVLTSIFPWVSVSQTPQSDKKVYYNLETMKNSNNENIVTLSEKVNITNICFFLILIFSIFSYLCLIVYRTRKYSSIPQKLMIIGSCAIVVISILIIFLVYNFTEAVNNTINMSTPYILAPLQYSHIILILGIALLIMPATSTLIIIMYLFNYSKDTKKGKKSLQKTLKKKSATNERQPELRETTDGIRKSEKSPTIKHEEIEDWLKDEVQNIEKHSESIKKLTADLYDEETVEQPKTQEKIKETIANKEITRIPEEKPIKKGGTELRIPFNGQDNTGIKIKESGKTYDIGMTKSPYTKHEDAERKSTQKPETDRPLSKKSASEPFKSVVKKTEVEIPDELVLSESFDKVLSSVIEKRQKEAKKGIADDQQAKTLEKHEGKVDVQKLEGLSEKISQDKTEKIAPRQDVDKLKLTEEKITTFTVRCPVCKNVFSVKKTGEVTRIKCPKCGKEGVVK